MFENGPMLGQIFENYIASELLKKQTSSNSEAKLYFYRTSSGIEIDFILTENQKIDFIEVKSSYTFKSSMTRSI